MQPGQRQRGNFAKRSEPRYSGSSYRPLEDVSIVASLREAVS